MRTVRLAWVAIAAVALVALGCKDSEPTRLELNGPATAVQLVSGDGQTATAGTTLSQALTIQVKDEQGRAVPAHPVLWSASGGTLSTQVDSTDADGRSTVSWQMPSEPGRYTATAVAENLSPLVFTAQALPGAGLLTFRYIDAGSYHGCGIATDERLYCWGYNGDGQLGLAPGESKSYPNLILNTERFRLVSGGRYHTCGVTLSGGIICWGQNRDSRSVAGDPTSFQAVQAGLLHTCGLSMGRRVWCWGSNDEGQVGSFQLIPVGGGRTVGVIAAGTRTITLTGLRPAQLLPKGTVLTEPDYLGGSRTIVHDARADGLGQVAVTMDAPTVYGPMPDGSLVEAAEARLAPEPPGPVESPFLVGNGYKTIAAGGLHSCGIKEDGTAWCWGFNAEGQLGNGGTWRVAPLPTLVASTVGFRTDPAIVPPSPDPDFPLPPGPFIAAGHAHTCALGLDNATYCWGLNENGQLGDGTTVSHASPHPVSGGLALTRITAGQSHTCGLTGSGQAYCWGDNTYGQLGDGSTTDRLAPTAVAGGLSFAYIKAGDLSTCGVTTVGVGYCWGNNEYGQIGNGLRGEVPVLVPTRVAFQKP